MFTIPIANSSAMIPETVSGVVSPGIAIMSRPTEQTVVIASSFSRLMEPDLTASIIPSSSETGINAPEDFRMRIYAARQKAWDRMLSDEFKNLPPLAKSLAARKSGEAWYAMRYVETAELILHINQNEIPEKAPLSIFIEKTENIADLLERTKGGTLKNRPKLFPVYPLVIPGDPIPVSGYMPLYEKDKKKAVEELTGVYFNSFKSLAERFLESQKHDRPE